MDPTSEPRIAWCSCCLYRTTHERVKHNRVGRDEYQCSDCSGRTYKCRVCDNMARGHLEERPAGFAARLRASHDQLLCAEHDGSIVSFETAGARLADLADYEVLLTRSKRNFQGARRIAGFAAGGALLLGPAAWIAAPGIAAALGAAGLLGAAGTGTAIATLSGAALTSASLAAIGGGLGMAGGTVFLTAAGAALGAREGARINNAYFGQIEGFCIEKLRDGVGPAVLVIDGFLTQGDDETIKDWEEGIAAHYGKNPLYKIGWESKRLTELGKLGVKAGAGFMAGLAAKKLAAKATKVAKPRLPVLGHLTTALGLAANPWHVAMTKASMTGILLADLLARTDHKEGFIILGHSLGARVAYYTLETLSTLDRQIVQRAYLLGGAVGREGAEAWAAASKSVTDRIYNAYSTHDLILRGPYKLATAFCSDPAGLGTMNVEVPERIENCDVSDIVKTHTDYKPKLSKVLAMIDASRR
jgi:hypothetical protein